MQAGELNTGIQVFNPVESTVPDGQGLLAYGLLSTVWGSCRALSGKELLAAKQINSLATHRIQIRYLAGVDSFSRLVIGGETYNIESVQPGGIQNREWLTILALRPTAPETLPVVSYSGFQPFSYGVSGFSGFSGYMGE
jgi:SPP1 family predicted phage head-tail adaptor